MIRLFKHYIPRSLLLLGFAEALVFFGAIFIATNGVLGSYLTASGAYSQVILADAALFFLILFAAMTFVGLYQRRLSDDLRDWLLRIMMGFLGGMLLLCLILAVFPGLHPGWKVVGLSGLLVLVAVIFLRTVYFSLADRTLLRQRVMVLGAGEKARQIEDLTHTSEQRGCLVVGFVAIAGEPRHISEGRIISNRVKLAKLAKQHCIDEIVVAVQDRRKVLPVDELLECKVGGIDVIDFETYYERQTGKIPLEQISPSWMIFSDGFKGGTFRALVKRSIDLSVSSISLLMLWPLMVLTALLIMLESGGRGPIFHRQARVGEMGRVFSLIKFRSMRVDAEEDGVARWAQSNDQRVTRIGRVLRMTRMDELPQLYNVFRGDMSFVGPRPERPHFVEELGKNIQYYNERHAVKPGITGWAQICLPYAATFEGAREKLQYDLYYVKNNSLFLDLTIILQTVEVILWRRGAH